jgi:hypothetical protein
MLDEISKDFYCSAGKYKAKCSIFYHCYQNNCASRHRKHPTPKQYKEEYREDVPDNMAVWVLDHEWILMTWSEYKKGYLQNIINIIFGVTVPFVVIACTPFSKPETNWRPV